MPLHAEEDLPALLAKAKAGDPQAMALAADRYFKDLPDLPMDREIFFEYASKSSARGVALGDAMLSRSYRLGLGTISDMQKGFEYARKSADAGCPAGWTSLGICYQYGFGVKPDAKIACDAYHHAYDMGEEYGSCAYAACLSEGLGTERDEEAGAKIYETLVANGSSSAAGSYATSLMKAKEGVVQGRELGLQDNPKARRLLQTALRLNPRFARAWSSLAYLTFGTTGLEDSMPYYLKAFRLHDGGTAGELLKFAHTHTDQVDATETATALLAKVAYEGGSRTRLVVMNYIWYTGVSDWLTHGGVPVDSKRAIAIAEEAIREMPDMDGYHNLGVIYLKGQQIDRAKGIDCFTVWSRIDPEGMDSIGRAIEEGGEAYAKDLPKAWAAFKAATNAGWPGDHLREFEKKLTPEQLAEGHEWLERGYPTARKYRSAAIKRLGIAPDNE